MTQVELWFSMPVRKLLKRGNFILVAGLKAKVLAFIDYFNRTMAKPFCIVLPVRRRAVHQHFVAGGCRMSGPSNW
jgi:hypothetical protein